MTAYNAGGESETSEPSQAITAMERFVKPRLDKDLLGKVRIRIFRFTADCDECRSGRCVRGRC